MTAIIMNLMLAFSMIVTPMLVRALVKGGISNAASTMGGVVLATAAMTPTGLMGAAKAGAVATAQKVKSSGEDDQPDPRRK